MRQGNQQREDIQAEQEGIRAVREDIRREGIQAEQREDIQQEEGTGRRPGQDKEQGLQAVQGRGLVGLGIRVERFVLEELLVCIYIKAKHAKKQLSNDTDNPAVLVEEGTGL